MKSPVAQQQTPAHHNHKLGTKTASVSKGSAIWPRHLGDLINAEMKLRGLSQEQVGQHFGISQSSVARWIDGTTMPKGERVAEVARFCGVDIAMAYRLNFRAEDLQELEPGEIHPRVKILERHVGDLAEQVRDMRDQVRITNEALATLLDRVQTARARNNAKI